MFIAGIDCHQHFRFAVAMTFGQDENTITYPRL
jgi:hypothetical protein